MRADDWAAVLLRLDARRAAAAGVALRRTDKGVVLAEGAWPRTVCESCAR
jgi:RNA:NAD 2'-phosphotransferase (TPT1/KptA family)